MIKIKEISATDTYPVRNAVLRKGKSIQTCMFPGDDLPTTKHFGIYNNHLIGVLSLFENNNPVFKNLVQLQLRGMAILEDFQRHGLGEKLIKHYEEFLKSENETLIWFNARENAVVFYEKLGYQITGSVFDIEDVGKHYLMFKELNV